MPGIGKACRELRVQEANKTWWIVYHIDEDAIVVLEVFAKTTQETPKSVIAICKTRLRMYTAI